MEAFPILNNFQWETCCLQYFYVVTWCNHDQPRLQIKFCCTEATYCKKNVEASHWKISFEISVSICNVVTICSSVPWSHREVELWPSGICVKLNISAWNFWVMAPKKCFDLSSPKILFICAKFEDIPWRRSWNSLLKYRVWENGNTPLEDTPPPANVSPTQSIKNQNKNHLELLIHCCETQRLCGS